MPLQIGIIGLPNVGKSTLFNVLTQAQNAEVANYPFCTIEPNQAIVPVPDPRLDKLAQLVGVSKSIKTTIEFVDIAGLVKGASKGEGLGNQFLGHIRNTDALLHVVRCFEDPNVIHINPTPDPQEDIEEIELELILADLEQIINKLDKLSHQVKGDKSLAPAVEMASQIQAHLEAGYPLVSFPDIENPVFSTLNQDLRFLTAKPVIFAANIGEEYLNSEHPDLKIIKKISQARNSELVQISAQIESDLNTLSQAERADYMALSGIEKSGLDLVVQKCYRILDLISFFTYNDEQARAWTIQKGTKAPQAAGKIHTDFERGFIKAEVISFPTFEAFGSTLAAREAGKLQTQGKEYVVQDGDIIYFKFNV
ncbi:MAG: redox-regulated ATPase YchF [Chloroflexota bacterium]|nr:MAG: redox-regulated ATPase YchF [Chloroflexota bacterium]